ncbi:CD109 antigen [Drosophila bipectinata]|uniref:CD109 antigen n=1 Tax=Drosophila bipectinata TaxID=42026 RepID=UPI001C8A409B|nr:CD109 antigen [Drosophila bipectinata]
MCMWLLGILILPYVSGINGNGIYSVMVPDTIRSHMTFNVGVSLHSASGDCNIVATLSGPSYQKTERIQIEPMTTKAIPFKVDQLPEGDYQLTVEGSGSVEFKKVAKLKTVVEKPSIYVQTDKATYKPEDLVQFRVLFLDRYMKATTIQKPITISIADGAQNRIQQWTDITPVNGVFSGELPLSDQPVLGTWQLTVSIQNETLEKKSFEVDKYVLPKFQVIVKTEENILATAGNIKASITAKYTFGKGVKGMATISIEGSSQAHTIDINGKVSFKIPFVASMKSPLKVVAVVTEDLTDLSQNGSAYVTLHQYRYRLESYQWPTSFRPQQELNFPVVVKHLNDSAVTGLNKNVNYTVSCCGMQRFTEAPIINGIATGTKLMPDIRCSVCHVIATLENSARLNESIYKEQKSFRIEINNLKRPKLNERLQFNVVSETPITRFLLTIVARGTIVSNSYLSMKSNPRYRTVKMSVLFSMIPEATFYVYSFEGEEMRMDMKTVTFEKDFGNSIQIAAPDTVQPGENVTLTVKTQPKSFVGLLGVDQSVRLLRGGNDLSPDKIFSDLGTHGTSGLIILTNANLKSDIIHEDCRDGEYCHNGFSTSDKFKTSKGDIMIPARSPSSTSSETSNPTPRKHFPETWLFENITEMQDGVAYLERKIPDTITSWMITGFSLNPDTGIALTKEATKIRAFKPFFVSTNLPYSVKRGEIIVIPVIVFNYMDETAKTKVSMDNSDEEYDFAEASSSNAQSNLKREKQLRIAPNSGKSITFMIRPKNVGLTILKISAISQLAGDAIEQPLKVEADGVTKYVNQPFLINLARGRSTTTSGWELEKELIVDIPKDAVPGSVYANVAVGGDIQAPVINGLGKMVNMPFGCGEQNMINFVPNILVLRYLDATGRSDPQLAVLAGKYLTTGYQRELKYKHANGAFSTWGSGEGITWLTAYVIRSFILAKPYTYVDPGVLRNGLNFLASRASNTGAFFERGRLVDFKASDPLALTSFVLLTFLENKDIAEYSYVISKAVRYVASEAGKSRNEFSLSIAALALQMNKHEKGEVILNRLDSMAIRQNGMMWWSTGVETTAYVLLAMLENGMSHNPKSVADWLIQQRNSNGGFGSSQDTVVALHALTKYSILIKTEKPKMVIEVAAPSMPPAKIDVNPENALHVHNYQIPKHKYKAMFRAAGQGAAMGQVSIQYNEAQRKPHASLKITPTVESQSNHQMVLRVCGEYTPLDQAKQHTNMVLMEIQLPSGYEIDDNELTKIKSSDGVRLAETKNEDTQVIVYFDSLYSHQPICVIVTAARLHAVADQKSSYVKLYDYYIPSLSTVEKYDVKNSFCDICKGADCGKEC